MPKYVLSVDQSTQGAKALIFDETGRILSRAVLPHRQIISDAGWVSHDPEEIFANVLKTARLAAEKAGVDKANIACMGISNQRETSLAWDKETGKPVCGVLGDSHAALFGHGCLETGMTKATYGTGSSIMMNIGDKPIASPNGLVTSLAWKYKGQVRYVMEGNVNYTGAVITWLKDNLGLIASAGETEKMALAAHPADTTCLVPAFTGLGAPYWNSEAQALICGMGRTTGKNEIVRAALDSIAFQIGDVIAVLEKDTGIRLPLLRVDGGPTKNKYLMQFQSDLLNAAVSCPDAEEVSAIGAACMAGISRGVYSESVLQSLRYRQFTPQTDAQWRSKKQEAWKSAVKRALI